MSISSRLLKLRSAYSMSRMLLGPKITFQYDLHVNRASFMPLSQSIICKTLSRSFGNGMSSPCWKCGMTERESKFFCQNCKALQKPTYNYNFFHLLDVNESYEIDGSELSKKFRQLQAVLHPDKFSNASNDEKEFSADLSSLVNKAFRTLSDPLERGLYLLELNGIPVEEGNTSFDKAFLLEIMELNEELESISTVDHIQEFHSRNNKTLKAIIQRVSQSFSIQNNDSARAALMEMKYYTSLEGKIKEKILQLGAF